MLLATLEERAAVAEELGVEEEEEEEEEGELEGGAGGAGAAAAAVAAVAVAAAAPAAPAAAAAAAAAGASPVASGGPITFHVLTPFGPSDAQLSISRSTYAASKKEGGAEEIKGKQRLILALSKAIDLALLSEEEGAKERVVSLKEERRALLGVAGENEEGGAAGGRAARPRRSGTDVSWRTLLGARVTAVRRPRGEALDSSGDEKDGEYERSELRLSSKKSVGCPRQKGYFLIGHH